MAGGGTVGHVSPGVAIAEALVRRGCPRQRIHFVGSRRGVEATRVPGAGFSLTLLPGRGIQRRLTAENIGAVSNKYGNYVYNLGVIPGYNPVPLIYQK